MLLVKTKLGQSTVHGIGLFADESISMGKKVWEFTPGFDLRFSKQDVERLPKRVQSFLKMYSWVSKTDGLVCVSSDHGKFFNHAMNNNVEFTYSEEHDELVAYATRDIKPGEELVNDYRSFKKLSW